MKEKSVESVAQGLPLQAEISTEHPMGHQEPYAPTSDTVEALWERVLLVDRARANEEIGRFDAVVQQAIEELHVDEYFERIESSLEQINAALTGDVPTSVMEQYDKRIQVLASRFDGKTADLFRSWIQQESEISDSWLTTQRREWGVREVIARQARRAMKACDALQVQKNLVKTRCLTWVVRRIATMEDDLRSLAETLPFDEQPVLKEFLVQMSIRRVKEQSERKPTLVERMIGKKETTPEEELKKLLGNLSSEYAGKKDRFGLSNADRLAGTIGRSAFRKGGGRKDDVETAQQEARFTVDRIEDSLGGESFLLEERPTLPKISGLDEFIRAKGFTHDIRSAVLGIRPILGRKDLVQKVTFESEQSQMNADHLGIFNREQKTISIYPHPKMGQRECIRSIAHEAGHAMRLEAVLPLKDAVRFSLEMRFSILFSGYVSKYSAVAKELYSQQIARAPLSFISESRDPRLEQLLKDSDVDEEWAEMVAYSLLPQYQNVLKTDKQELVRRYLEKYGIDLAEAHGMFGRAVADQTKEETLEMEHLKRLLHGRISAAQLSKKLEEANLN